MPSSRGVRDEVARARWRPSPVPSASIGYLLEGFLADLRSRGLDAVDYRSAVTVVDLLRGYLDRYGYHRLSEADRDRFEQAYFGEGDADAFCCLFGVDELRAGIVPFVEHHLPRRVGADRSVVALAARVTGQLSEWLDRRSAAPPATVD